jgi:hypothetical protein
MALTLELRRDGNISGLYICIGTKDFVKVDLRVSIHSDATIKTVLEVFKDCRGC